MFGTNKNFYYKNVHPFVSFIIVPLYHMIIALIWTGTMFHHAYENYKSMGID